MAQSNKRTFYYQTGFTLVEIMVGLVIGMLVSMVIMQVISVFEVQKRTTTGTADAQTNGSIALYNITRELRMAGFPLTPSTNSPLECTTLNINGTADATVPNRLTPAAITDGISDTITIRYGDSDKGGIPTAFTPPATVASNFGCQTALPIALPIGAIAISADGVTCDMTNVTSALAATPTVVTLQDAVTGAELTCVGTWNEITYAINNSNLERNGTPSVTEIVNIQAQYGVSAAANSNSVTQWVDATGGTWAAPSVSNRNRIKAVRIAVVARNPKMEPTNVTNPCSSTNTPNPTGLCAWAGSTASPAPTIDLSANANWQRYRYRVFETIIPLQNVIWSKGTL